MRYTNAAEFVADYVENLSVGGLFIAGAHQRELLEVTDIDIELPGQGSWAVRARAVFRLDAEAARKAGRRPGIGFQIVQRPPGFDDALLGYLLRLGRRRDFHVMAGEILGAGQLAESGYRIVPLAAEASLARALADASLLAIVVPPPLEDAYRRIAGADRVRAIKDPDEIPDLIAHLDALMP